MWPIEPLGPPSRPPSGALISIAADVPDSVEWLFTFDSEKPPCASLATAWVTSLIERLCDWSLVRSSVSSMISVSPARLLRDQSMTAIRVLSPGASEVL